MEYVEKRMTEEASRPSFSPEVQTVFTPINAILLALLIYVFYKQFKPAPPVEIPVTPAPIVFRTFTPLTLLQYNGQKDMPVYLSVRGKVFDVSLGRNFYGPGGPYENFAGRDASRGLAKGSFEAAMLTQDLNGPLDTLSDLTADELDSLKDWEGRFHEKYLVVGRLISVDDEAKEKEKEEEKNS
ncbi:Damage response protein 1 [Erysiphe necator]|nr:Damage response protein 1 [Erysiphe necator]